MKNSRELFSYVLAVIVTWLWLGGEELSRTASYLVQGQVILLVATHCIWYIRELVVTKKLESNVLTTSFLKHHLTVTIAAIVWAIFMPHGRELVLGCWNYLLGMNLGCFVIGVIFIKGNKL